MVVATPADRAAPAARTRPGAAFAWQPLLPLLAALALILFVLRDTAVAMVGIWSRSETFAHAFLVPPIVAWLIWRQRHKLALLKREPQARWLVPMVLAAALWLVGELAEVHAPRQFALVACLVLTVPLLLGWPVARQIGFALLFMFFCVPMGEFLVDPMMAATADFTVLALQWSGIPVYREGLQFVIPSGHWSVVEACSGVRYLIASVMVGTLFAHLNFRSPRRQALFIVLSACVPVVANWLRAYLTVMLGHFSDNRLAVGVDHLLYGWVFFGIVISLMFMVGARFADLREGDEPAARPLTDPAPAAAPGRMWLAVFAVAVLLTGVRGTMAWLEAQGARATPPSLSLPAELPGGWRAEAEPLSGWEPHYQNPSAKATRTYAAGPRRVAVWVGLYQGQSQERKLVTSTNVLVESKSPHWLHVDLPPRTLGVDGSLLPFKAAAVRSPADPKVSPTQRLLVLRAYRVGGEHLVGDLRTTLQLAARRLSGRGDAGATIMIYAQVDEEGRGADALERFAEQALGRVVQAVDAANGP